MTTATSKSRSPHAVVAHDYRRAAERAQAAGFDGVEIQAANGWELNPTADMKVWSAPIQRGILKFTGWDVLAPNIIYAPVRVSAQIRT